MCIEAEYVPVVGAGIQRELSIHSAQFYCEPKTALKNKVYSLKYHCKSSSRKNILI